MLNIGTDISMFVETNIIKVQFFRNFKVHILIMV